MDLLGEASSETRILTARHISAEKALPDTNNAVNTTLLCYSYSMQPDFGSYLAAIQPYACLFWSCGAVVLLVICALYFLTIRSASQFWRESINNVAIVLTVYPVVTASALVAIIIPRSLILCEAIAQEVVMIAMYHYFRMLIAECGGVDMLIRRAGASEHRLDTRVLPCCCWPCCVIPRPRIQKQHLTSLRYLILQMPVIQGIIYFIILILWAEDMTLQMQATKYIQVFIAASILSGMWGIIMCVRLAESLGLRPRARLLSLQLVLLIVKLQCGTARSLPGLFNLPCVMSLHPFVFVNLVQNCVTIMQMLLLSIWAWRLYSVPPGKVVDKVQHAVVSIVEDISGVFDVKAVKSGIDNKSFKDNGDI
ncbi:organic solute transporter alpha-like protein [Galleria mellonella]|uniref:Organic solute transporter alpha-like protein n=1 Tax=Galleria mellonella TaxID=7137 RepID=A0A6J1WFR7_GALME|nr:organic solute transporter alpha-like protein [Galleria mellonella]